MNLSHQFLFFPCSNLTSIRKKFTFNFFLSVHIEFLRQGQLFEFFHCMCFRSRSGGLQRKYLRVFLFLLHSRWRVIWFYMVLTLSLLLTGDDFYEVDFIQLCCAHVLWSLVTIAFKTVWHPFLVSKAREKICKIIYGELKVIKWLAECVATGCH